MQDNIKSVRNRMIIIVSFTKENFNSMIQFNFFGEDFLEYFLEFDKWNIS